MRNGVKRGEIYYIANSKYYCTDPSNEAGRPGIIVSSDELNAHAEVVEVVYLTTKEKRPMPTHATIICKAQSTAMCETIYTVTKDRIGDYVRTCTAKEMAEIDRCMKHSLGIADSDSKPEEVEREDDYSTVVVEKNLYKKLYESLLDRMTGR